MKSTNHSRRSGRPRLHCYPSVYFLVNRASFLVRVRHFALVAELQDVRDESCGGDVEDELVPELDDNPGTTRGTKFSVLHKKFFPCLVNRGF